MPCGQQCLSDGGAVMEKCVAISVTSGRKCTLNGWLPYEDQWYCTMHDPVRWTRKDRDKHRKPANRLITTTPLAHNPGEIEIRIQALRKMAEIADSNLSDELKGELQRSVYPEFYDSIKPLVEPLMEGK